VVDVLGSASSSDGELLEAPCEHPTNATAATTMVAVEATKKCRLHPAGVLGLHAPASECNTSHIGGRRTGDDGGRYARGEDF